MDPFTISAGISAIGGLFKGITGFFGGNAEAKIHENNAQTALRQASVNADIALQQGDQVAADAATRAAANGGGFVGSSMGVIQNLASQAMYNARAQIYKGRVEAQGERYQASVAKANALGGLIGSGFGAVGSMLGGMKESALFQQQNQALLALRGDDGLAAAGGGVPY